jgi:hypothetical protein
MGVQLESRTRAYAVLIHTHKRAEAEIGRVVVGACREAVTGRDALVDTLVPVAGKVDLDHGLLV